MKSEFEAYDQQLNQIGSFGIKDVMIHQALEMELVARGFELTRKTEVSYEKR